MNVTDHQLNEAEEAVILLSRATGLTEKQIVNVLFSGFAMEGKGVIDDDIRYIMDEIQATFDAY